MTPETAQIVARVAASPRYRDVATEVIERLASEEALRARTRDEAVKRVKRRLHQSVGAYAPARHTGLDDGLARVRGLVGDDPRGPGVRGACLDLLARHASTRERLPYLDRFYLDIWQAAGGAPRSIIDLGCGLGPLAVPWMGLAADAHYLAIDVDRALLALVDGLLAAVGQPHTVAQRDLAAAAVEPLPVADLAFLLKLVPVLDRQDASAAARLLGDLRCRTAVVSFPVRSLGGRARGMERTYRARMETLAAGLGERLSAVTEASVRNELVFVLALAPDVAADG